MQLAFQCTKIENIKVETSMDFFVSVTLLIKPINGFLVVAYVLDNASAAADRQHQNLTFHAYISFFNSCLYCILFNVLHDITLISSFN